MTSNFIVSVGGTGAKVTESLVHLCAAGYLGPSLGQGVDSWLYCQMVDADPANGMLARCLSTIDQYRRCRKIGLGKSPLFGAEIDRSDVYTPIDLRNNNLNAMFNPVFKAERGSDKERSEAMLLRCLFSEEEMSQPLEQGFRGRPAIGAVCFGRSVKFDEGAWSTFSDLIRQRAETGNVRILFVGSVFGGSGAAGIPTLVRLVYDEFTAQRKDKVQIGLVLYQPYFDFRRVEVEQGSIAASSQDFALATAEALQYYSDAGYFSYCHSVYTLGEQNRAYIQKGREREGGKDQVNPPHYLELIGALGAVEFFRGSRNRDKLFLASRHSNKGIGWDDLPQPNLRPSESASPAERAARYEQRDELERKFARLTRFALAYHYYFYPQVFADPKKRADYDVYFDSITRDREQEALSDLLSVDEYCGRYLEWLLNVLRPNAQVDLDLFRVEQIGHKRDEDWLPWDLEEYQKLDSARKLPDLVVQPAGSPKGPDLTAIRIGASTQRTALASDPSVRAGRVLRCIYDVC